MAKTAKKQSTKFRVYCLMRQYFVKDSKGTIYACADTAELAIANYRAGLLPGAQVSIPAPRR